MKIKWFGHAAFLLSGNNVVLIDPFITDNPSAPCKWSDINCEIICITHGHQDHFGDAIKIAKKNNAVIISNHEIAEYASQSAMVEGLNKGGSIKMKNTKITMTNAFHSSSMKETYMGEACGYIIESGAKIYHAGDTCLFSDMRLIGDAGLDVAILPIGDRYTMGIDDAVSAVALLMPKIVIPMHYDTFPIIKQNPKKFKALVEAAGKAEVVILKPGEEFEV
ncbi:MAG: metal-dependent hydrolase [Candidatus Thermoplasmatota archaeon]